MGMLDAGMPIRRVAITFNSGKIIIQPYNMRVMWKANSMEHVNFFTIYINVKIDFDPSLITQWITQMFR